MRLALAPFALMSTIVLAGTSLAQLSIGFDRNDKPRLLCKAWTGNDNVVMGTSEVVNNPRAKDRYAYHARKYGENIGVTIYTDCLSFEGITDEYRATFTPGSSFQNYEKETVTVVEATFLPANWESTPTPDERKKATAKGNAKPSLNRPGAATASGSSESATNAAQERAERARLLREENDAIRAKNKREAEAFQRDLTDYEAKKAAHEQMLADHRASIAKASAERAAHEVKLAESVAAAAAHEREMADYQRKLASPAAKGTEGIFQSTGMLRPTRNEAMANLLNMSSKVPELFDIQCNERKVAPTGWTCFGKYRQIVTRSSVAKQ